MSYVLPGYWAAGYGVGDIGPPQVLDVPSLVNTSTLYAHALEVSGRTLELPLLTGSPTLYAPTVVVGSVTLQAPFLGSVAQLYEMRITQNATPLTLPLHTNAGTFFLHTLAQTVLVSPPLLVNGNVFYRATIAGGFVALEAPRLTNFQEFFPPTIVSGPTTVTAPVLSNTNAFYNHQVRLTRTNWGTVPTTPTTDWEAVRTN